MSDGFNPVSAALDVFHAVNGWCDDQPDPNDDTVQDIWESARELAEWVAAQVAATARLEGELTALRAEVAALRPSIRPAEHVENVKPSTLRKRRQRAKKRALVTPESVTSSVTGHASVTLGHASVTPPLSDSPLSISSESKISESKNKEENKSTEIREIESARERDVVTPDVTPKRDKVTHRVTRWTRAPGGFVPNADAVALAATLGVNLEAELAKFRDHEYAKPKTDADAAFRTWLRNAAQWSASARPANGHVAQLRPVRGAMAPVSTTFDEGPPDWERIAREVKA